MSDVREIFLDNYKLAEEIKKIKNEKNAIFLVHNYQLVEVKALADFTGDSLGLAIKAQNTDADLIVLCGVEFMAETAKLLNPEKTVLLPERNAGCPMAEMIEKKDMLDLKDQYPNGRVVSYVNTTAEVKAFTDICCTSANANKVVNTIPLEEEVIFVPDINLGQYVERITGRELILWKGFCPTHHRLLPEDVIKAKEEHPDALVVVHPECRPEVIDLADGVESTSGMIRFASESTENEFLIGTEVGHLSTLKAEIPNKTFFQLAPEKMICPNMKMTTVKSIYNALVNLEYEIEIPEEYQEPAKRAIDKMIEVGR